MEAAAASAMDFHALSRRELQALCKRNGVRANMTNAAMADALQDLASVDGIDEIGTTLCLPTPGRSAMKSAAKSVAVAGEEPQQGSPLPRGRRVSVMSPAAIRMDFEEGDDELKRDLVKEIVRTPGVALRSTSRRARATPAPLQTPATLRRSTRTAARKAVAPVEAENLVEEVSTVKRTTRRASARSKMMVDLDQEGEAAATSNVQQEEPKDVTSDVKCNDLEEEEEVTKPLEGDNIEGEPEEGEEADSSDVANGSALLSDKSCDEEVAAATPKVQQEETKDATSDVKCNDLEEEEEATKLLEGDNVEDESDEGEEANSSDAANGSALLSDKSCDDIKLEEVAAVEEEDEVTKLLEGEDDIEDELEEGEEADSSDASNGSALLSDKSCDDIKLEEVTAVVEQEATKQLEVEGPVAEQKLMSVEKFAPLAPMEDSPILGVLSKAEATELVVEKEQYATAEDGEGVNEITDENNLVAEDKAVAAGEEEASEEAMEEVDCTIDTIVKSLDEFTIEEETKKAEELQKQLKFDDLHSKSLRQLKTMLKDTLNAKEGKKQIAAEGGRRLPLAEMDGNTRVDN